MNWQSLIADIQKHGELSQAQIASACRCGQATISELAKGVTTNPSFNLGHALISLNESIARQKPSSINKETTASEADRVPSGVPMVGEGR